MFEHIKVLEIAVDSQVVGALSIIPGKRGYAFQYTPNWVQNGYSISPILLPLNNEIHTFNDLSEETWKLLPPPLADCLPDRFGNALIDSELAKDGVSKNEITALDRLAYVGKNAMGALEFYPVKTFRFSTRSIIDISEMVSVARSVVFGDTSSDSHSQKAIRNLLSIGTSAGGARPKAIINIDPETGRITSGQISKKGLEPWLLKFDGVAKDSQLGESQNYGRVEYAYSLMAKAAKINMPETRLLIENDRAHFMTRRFDRKFDAAGNPQKIHMQTLCGIAGVDFNLIHINDYAQLFTVMRKLRLPESDLTQGFRRMVFNFAASNCDDHAKNHTFLLDEYRKWRLSPAYDITFAYDSQNKWLNEHLMGVMGKFAKVNRKEFLYLAEKFHIQEAKLAIKQVNEAVGRWSEFGKEAALSSSEIKEKQKWHYIIE